MTLPIPQYPGTARELNAEMRGLCAQDTVLLSAVPACLRPALRQFMVGRGLSETPAGEWLLFARDLRLFWEQVCEVTGLPYQIQTAP